MKIAVIHFGRKGAGPAISYEMAKALSIQGHSVFYYASAEVENRIRVEKETFKKRFIKTYNSKFTFLLSVLFQINIRRVVKQIEADKPDVVYSTMNDLWCPFLFSKLKKFVRVKTIHDVGIHEGSNSFLNVWWNKTNFRQADKYVILSHKFVPTLIERGIDKKNIVVIPHAGFDYYVPKELHEEYHGNGKKLLFFGRIDQYKGLEVLLDALPTVVNKHPDVMLSIVGNGSISHYQDRIQKCKDNLEIHNRWIKDEEVSGYVNSCDIVVLPYTHATQSGVIPLAYAFSKPVVATRVGCLDEQVLEGKTGIMCDGGDSKSLAEAIISLLDDPYGTKKMGEFANKYMKTHLTWEASARLLIDFLNK